jgi:inner membrane protein
MPSFTQWPAGAWRNSRTFRLLAITALGLLLNIPLGKIEQLVHERQQRNDAARAEITTRWGGPQTVSGPALVVPIAAFHSRPEEDSTAPTATRHAVFLPRQLRISGQLRAETRQRGIFAVPVYTLELHVSGEFGPIDTAALGLRTADVNWERAAFSIGISDVHALVGQPILDWNGRGAAFEPGLAGLDAARNGIHAPLEPDAGSGVRRFSFSLSMNGSSELMFAPFAEDTHVELGSNYAHPSFQGKWLPISREVTGSGFSAQWAISYLGRGYAQSWITGGGIAPIVDASRFGVRLEEPVDHYRMSERSVKYAILFVLLTFLLLWLMEVLSGIHVHPVQFLLVGSALCLFYLLELALAEHIGFAAAYAVASALIVLLIGGYCAAALRSRSRAMAVSAACSGLYLWLYFLLANEDYSVLVGSLALLAILAATMYCTRRKDWYAAD